MEAGRGELSTADVLLYGDTLSGWMDNELALPFLGDALCSPLSPPVEGSGRGSELGGPFVNQTAAGSAPPQQVPTLEPSLALPLLQEMVGEHVPGQTRLHIHQQSTSPLALPTAASLSAVPAPFPTGGLASAPMRNAADALLSTMPAFPSHPESALPIHAVQQLPAGWTGTASLVSSQFNIADYFGSQIASMERARQAHDPLAPPRQGLTHAAPAAPTGDLPTVTSSTSTALPSCVLSMCLDTRDPPVLQRPVKDSESSMKSTKSLLALADAYEETQKKSRAIAGPSSAAAGKAPPRGKFVKRVKRVKKEKVASPIQSSKHCHICARSGQASNLAGCKNLTSSGCRKVVCRKCFDALGLGAWEAVTAPTFAWACVHCTGSCPDKAQCAIYAKTNARRRDVNLRKRGSAATAQSGAASKALCTDESAAQNE
jgi:hypothetical protein